MAFQELLGNEQLKYRITGLLKNRKVSHSYLITGPEGSGKHTLARWFSAAIQCTDKDRQPCLSCPQCRKVMAQQHPDIITVDDTEHRQLPLARVREIVADTYVRPNEGNRKIYIFEHAEKLSVPDQNALLKAMEEPPAHVVFLLLIPNSNLLLATIRSRCAEFALSPLPSELILRELQSRCPGKTEAEYRRAAACRFLGQAMEQLEHPSDNGDLNAFVTAFTEKDKVRLLELLTGMEKYSAELLQSTFQSWRVFLTEALAVRYGMPAVTEAQTLLCKKRSAREISDAIDALQRAENDCTANVTKSACGALAVRLAK